MAISTRAEAIELPSCLPTGQRKCLEGRGRQIDWLREPNFALGDETPLEFADTVPGARRVERLLGQIEHGIPT